MLPLINTMDIKGRERDYVTCMVYAHVCISLHVCGIYVACLCLSVGIYVCSQYYNVNALCLMCTCVCIHMMYRMHACVSVCVCMCTHRGMSICVCL